MSSFPVFVPSTDSSPATAALPPAPTLRIGLERAFAEFYNALFDAACASEGQELYARHLATLRKVKARESSVIEAVCADMEPRGPDAARAAVVVPISAAGQPDSTPVHIPHLLESLTRRCAVLPLEADERALLKKALVPLLGAVAFEARASPVVVPVEDDTERLARLVSRFRAGGLMIPHVSDPEGAPEPVVTATAPEPAAVLAPRRLRAAHFAGAALLLGLGVYSAGPAPDLFVQPGLARDAVPPVGAGLARDVPGIGLKPDLQPDLLHRAQGALPQDAPLVGAGLARDLPAADARLAVQVQFLLTRGDTALAELRLTEPFPDSAAANYLAALAIDAGNAPAQQGLERIVERYLWLARNALSRNEQAHAQQLLQRAQSVLPGYAPLRQLQAELDSAALTQR